MNQYPGYNGYNVQPNQSSSCLKIAIITLASIGFVIWTAGLGVSAGKCFEPDGMTTTRFNGFLLVLVHAAYIFFTSEIVYLVAYTVAFSYDDLRKLRSVTSKLLAATLVGFGINISAIIHTVEYDFHEDWYIGYIWFWNAGSIVAAFACSFTYLWTIILFICTAVFYKRSHQMIVFGGVRTVPGNMQIPTVTGLGMPMQPTAHAYFNSVETVAGTNLPPSTRPQSRDGYALADNARPPILRRF